MISFTPEALQLLLDEKDQIIAAERAAREQAESEIKEWKLSCGANAVLRQEAESARDQLEQECKAWEKSTRDTHNAMARAEQAEARLVEAMQIIRFLFYHRMPLGEKIEDMVYPQEPEQHQDIVGFLASTTPPPLLVELQGLRDGMDALVKGTIAAKEKSNAELAHWIRVKDDFVDQVREMTRLLHAAEGDNLIEVVQNIIQQRDSAEKELATLKLKLEVAKEALVRLDNTFSYDVCKSIVRQALSQLNELENTMCANCEINGPVNCPEHGKHRAVGRHERNFSMTNDEQIRFLDNMDAAIRFHQTNQENPRDLSNAAMIYLHEVRTAFAKACHLENYTKDLNPPAV